MPTSSVLVRAAVAIGLAATTPPAEAQAAREFCASHDEVVQRLHDRFGETLRSAGLHRDDRLVEVYASEDTGTWTILVTRPDGVSCLLASGELWEPDARPLAHAAGNGA